MDQKVVSIEVDNIHAATSEVPIVRPIEIFIRIGFQCFCEFFHHHRIGIGLRNLLQFFVDYKQLIQTLEKWIPDPFIIASLTFRFVLLIALFDRLNVSYE